MDVNKVIMVIEIITIDMVDKEPERKRGNHLGSFHKLCLHFLAFFDHVRTLVCTVLQINT